MYWWLYMHVHEYDCIVHTYSTLYYYISHNIWLGSCMTYSYPDRQTNWFNLSCFLKVSSGQGCGMVWLRLKMKMTGTQNSRFWTPCRESPNTLAMATFLKVLSTAIPNSGFTMRGCDQWVWESFATSGESLELYLQHSTQKTNFTSIKWDRATSRSENSPNSPLPVPVLSTWNFPKRLSICFPEPARKMTNGYSE